MGPRIDPIRTAVRSVLASSAFVAGSVFAADEPKEEATRAVLDRVEVTGSRIKRTQLEGAMPVTTVTREDIERTGIQSIGDLLQELPAAGASLNTNFNNGGDGGTYIDLRNLGAERVLVLVNGRRWVPASGNFGVANGVDLNTIPFAVIERVEVLKDGASAVYGSDAIAGVVNIITKKDYDGAQANAYIGQFDEGDGRQEAADFTLGSSGARGSAVMNASYYKAEPVWAGDRNISAEPLFGTGNRFGSTTTPMGRFRIRDPLNVTGGQFAVGGPYRYWTGQCLVSGPCPTGQLSFGATRDTGAGTDPTAGVQPGDFRPFDIVADPYNFAPDNYLATPSERWALYAQTSFAITDNITFVSEAVYQKLKAEALLAAMPVVVGATGSFNAGQLIGIDATNPYNPFGLTLSPTNPPAAGQLFLFGAQRRFVETGGRSFNRDSDTYRFGAGLEGVIEIAGRAFDWDAGATYSESRNMAITYGLINTARLAASLGPVASCISPCVPLNMFGGVGTITQPMLDYVTFNAHDDVGVEQRDYAANLSGEIFDLPAGAVGLAVGLEHLAVEGFFQPDALISAGNTTGNVAQPTAGAYDVSEAYAEVAIPLLRDVPFAEMLEVSVAMRYSDYSNFGETTNSKLGLRWQPFGDLLVRATYQHAFRAPSIGDLYSQQFDSFAQFGDICSVSTINGGTGQTGSLDPTPDNVQEAQTLANCTNAAVLFGATTYSPQIVENATDLFVPSEAAAGGIGNMYGQANVQIRITAGGNPDLGPETAESTTLGFVYTPGYVEGLSLSLDWYSIELSDAITFIFAGTYLDQCYNLGVQAFCEYIDRQATGDIEDLQQIAINADSYLTSGIDLNVVWRLGEVPFAPGEWKVVWDTTWIDDYEVCVVGAACIDYVQFNRGDSALPMFKSLLGIEWTYGDWEANWRSRFIGRQYELCTSSAAVVGFICSNPTGSTNALGATTYHSVQVSYTVGDWDTRFTVGIENVGDKAPPLSYMAFANSFDATTYEIPGRFPYLRISKAF
jgi:outer membrane receptor protein involved in Fe transport